MSTRTPCTTRPLVLGLLLALSSHRATPSANAAIPPAADPRPTIEFQPETAWSGSLQIGQASIPISGVISRADHALLAWFDVPALGQYHVEFEGEADNSAMTLSTPGRQAITLDGRLDGDAYTGEWSGMGTGGEFSLRRAPPPTPVESREVRFESDGHWLAGTVLLPESESPIPAMVWTHGSGDTGRESNTYRRDAWALARAGIASIIYDKRGVGDSQGDWRDATFEDLARDAIAAKQLLQSLPEIDPGRIGVGGLSQGGWISPLAHHLGGDFSLIVAISPSARTPSLQHHWVVTNRMKDAGFGPAATREALDTWRAVEHFQRTGEGEDEANAALLHAQSQGWYAASTLPPHPARPLPGTVKSWLFHDTIPVWKQTEVPVYAYWGSADKVVEASHARPALEEALGHNADAAFRTFPGAGHDLEIGAGRGIPMLAPGVHEQLVSWVTARFGQDPSP